MSALALAGLHLDLLYERDDAGLMLRSRDPTVPAPWFHLMRTTEGNHWSLSAALSGQQRDRLQEALAAEPVIADLGELERRPPLLDGIRGMLAEVPSAAEEYRGPAFAFGSAPTVLGGAAELLADPRDVLTVAELGWIREVALAEHPLSGARNPSGEVVAVCHSARSTAAAAEAGVETAPEYRGRGLAVAVVLAWAAAVKSQGRVPIYSTQWSNHASRAVARKLGLVPFGEDYHIG